MRIYMYFLLFFIWIYQVLITIKNFSLLGLIYFFILTYSFIIISGILDFKKFIFKSLIFPITILFSISILAYLGIINNHYIYLLGVVVLFIPLIIFQSATFRREYLLNLIDNFVEEVDYAKFELKNFNDMIDYLNSLDNESNKTKIPNLTESDTKVFIQNIRIFKIYIIKKSLFELLFQGINKDVNILLDYIDEKYNDIFTENHKKFFDEVTLKISSGNNTIYQEGIIDFYNYIFGGNQKIDGISLFASQYPKNIINRLQEKNMKLFFRGIGSVKIS